MSSCFKYEMKQRLLTVDNISVVYDERPILRDLSFNIDDIVRPDVIQGQVVSLLGPSGMGKTQLFRCIAGLQKPTVGNVRLNGDTKDVEAGEVGVVMQSYPLLGHRTIMGNLQLVAPGKEGEALAIKYLERFKLIDKRGLYPSQLSGGQRQRVAIIQQLLCSTKFILMDEPFSGLDPVAKQAVCEVINEISHMDELNTTIVITHDISAALAISDHVLLLGRDNDPKGGKIPGARIQKVYDLIERDIAWHADVEHQPNFRQTLSEITSSFFAL